MNRNVYRLLANYLWRTLGAWALLGSAQMMQTSIHWTLGLDRLPLLGVVIAATIFLAVRETPEAVLRTLPLTRREAALFRWWAAIGLPGVLICVCLCAAWLENRSTGWNAPGLAGGAALALALWAALGLLSVLPLPALAANRSNFPAFSAIWGILIIAACYGVPLHFVPRPLAALLLAAGIAAVIVSFVRALRGQLTQLPVLAAWRRESRPAPREPAG